MALDHDLGRSCACNDLRVTEKVVGLGNEATACVRSIASSLTKKNYQRLKVVWLKLDQLHRVLRLCSYLTSATIWERCSSGVD